MFNHKAVSLFITAVFILGACYHDRTARVQNKRICIAVQGVFSSLYADLHRAERTRASNPYIRAEPKGCGLFSAQRRSIPFDIPDIKVRQPSLYASFIIRTSILRRFFIPCLWTSPPKGRSPVPMTCKAARGISIAEKFFCGDDITHIKAS